MMQEKSETIHPQDEQLEFRPDVESDTSTYDLEKRASSDAGHISAQNPLPDEEYVVTAKTWAVIVVCCSIFNIACAPG